MRTILLAIIMLGVMLWAVDPWTGDIGPVPWWVKDNTSSQSYHKYRGICVINDSVAWVVGESGRVWKRTDGIHSHNWVQLTNLPPGYINYHLNDVCFVDADKGWIVGEKKAEPNKYRGIVYKTINGGANWDSVIPLPSPPNLPTPFLKVRFAWSTALVDYVGYIACGNGMVLYSEDAGDNWVRRPSPWSDKDSVSVWYNGLWMDATDAYCNNLWVSGDAFGTALQFDATDFSGFKQIKYPQPLASAIIRSYRT